MTGRVLEIRDLSVTFPLFGRVVRAVEGCSFGLDKGEILGLVGESGCGKSVTALACLGLVPPPGVVAGSIVADGREVVGRTEPELASFRGEVAAMIFQNPMTALNPFFTVGQQLVAVIRAHRILDRAAARREAVAALESVHLPDPKLQLGRYPHQLSGGQIQRVMIAMALACRPKILIADEATTALDVTIQAQIIVLLRDLAKTRDLAILFITHDLGVVADFEAELPSAVACFQDDFERRQMAAARAKLDQVYEARNGLTKSPSADADHAKLSSTSRT